ncbi:MAG: hypothetical protein HY040_08170 [Planctomycetes bacterium]|nr:hypothetical protein [Planctomycetota bacterium]
MKLKRPPPKRKFIVALIASLIGWLLGGVAICLLDAYGDFEKDEPGLRVNFTLFLGCVLAILPILTYAEWRLDERHRSEKK